jgi:hypothetical protein
MVILLISASWVSRITGMSHLRQSYFIFVWTIVLCWL